jgi:hypothetical protein
MRMAKHCPMLFAKKRTQAWRRSSYSIRASAVAAGEARSAVCSGGKS